MSTITRKYAMTKIEAGDYLLPSNDGRTIWRIYYQSVVGGSEDNVEWDWTPSGWYASKYRGGGPWVSNDWGDWEFWDGPWPTREAAINGVIR